MDINVSFPLKCKLRQIVVVPAVKSLLASDDAIAKVGQKLQVRVLSVVGMLATSSEPDDPEDTFFRANLQTMIDPFVDENGIDEVSLADKQGKAGGKGQLYRALERNRHCYEMFQIRIANIHGSHPASDYSVEM
ncbi:hypothetical protein CSKR_202733 [Clonorchis sinensis]|uniref:Uncharacterized protein n=1 Tax=Clonorchis sinensis TaxID=79923 RepID=A0A8T1M1U7_CLOSI|nr:hypothetical protein CSKR_202733 [Clonorchis sinensis]